MSDISRDFLKLWIGQTISEIGSRITREGLPLTAILLIHATAVQMGLLASAGSASVLLFGVAAGVIADRMRRRPLMIGADIARALLLVSIPLAARLNVLSFSQLLGVAVLAGLLTVQFDVAYQSYLPSILPREGLFEGNRRLTMSAATAEILGPGITGVLIQTITAPIAILLDSISFLVSAASVWSIRKPEAALQVAAHESLWQEASQGARAIAHHPMLRALGIRSIVAFFSMGTFFTLYLLFAIRVLHMSTSALGFTIAMGGVGSLTGAWLAKRLAKFHAGAIFLGSALVQASTGFLTPLAASAPRFAAILMGLAQLIGDTAWTIYYVNETSLRQSAVGPEVLGRVNAAMQLASRGMLPLGALAAGALASWIGITATLWAGSAGVLLSCVFLIPLTRKIYPLESIYGNGNGPQPVGRETESGTQ